MKNGVFSGIRPFFSRRQDHKSIPDSDETGKPGSLWIYASESCFGFSLHVDGGVHEIHVFLIQLFPQKLDGLAEPLEMHDLPLPEEFDYVIHIRIVGQPQDVVVGHPGFLF